MNYQFQEPSEVIYAQKNSLTNNECYHCNKKIKGNAPHAIHNHKIALIRPDKATTDLARQLQAKLDDVYSIAVKKGYVLPVTAIMTGAIIATVGGKEIKAIALSSGNANKFASIIENTFGNKVIFLTNNVEVTSFRSILGISLSKKMGEVAEMTIEAPAYPVGSCAAQKLLNYVIQYALQNKHKITKIRMSEIYWKTAGKSNWATGEVVPPCNTCNYVLPMMLCNFDDMGDRYPYEYPIDSGG